MKPLNAIDRKRVFMKFLMASLTVLGLFGYSIYSYVFVKGQISESVIHNIEEIGNMEKFIDKANVFVASFREADNETDRSNYRLELNSLIRENQNEFGEHDKIFNSISEKYRDLLRTTERANDNGEKACAGKIEEFEHQIEEINLQMEDLNLQIAEQADREESIVKIKAGLQRITEETLEIGDELGGKDWCNGPGEGRDEVKEELKLRLRTISKDIINRIENL